jgi:hypothetical protein
MLCHVVPPPRYALSLSVTGLALAHKHYPGLRVLNPLWFAVSVFTTLYCFYWGACVRDIYDSPLNELVYPDIYT